MTSTAHYIQKAIKENFVRADAFMSLYESDQGQRFKKHAIVIGKKTLARAVDRNTMRRRIFAALTQQDIAQKTHITLLYRAKKMMSQSDINKSLAHLLQKK